MELFTQPKDLANFSQHIRQEHKKTLALVPTMGALHKGHLSLIQKAKAMCENVIVSIFVNPTQFGANEDFSKYPRKLEADLEICKSAGVDAVFAPDASSMYGENEMGIIAPKNLSSVFEGAIRVGHFDGVCQIVLKLFSLANPTHAFFGQKDAQQLIIIEQMVRSLFLPISIVACPIIRDSSGLALSSRNAYLDEPSIKTALKISQAIYEASKVIAQGIFDATSIKQASLKKLQEETPVPLEVEYLALVNRYTLKEIPTLEVGKSLLLVAARVSKVRLLDNLWI